MVIKMSEALRNARAQAIVDAINYGAGPGTLDVYTSPMPTAGGDAVTTQTKLGTLTFAEPVGTISGGVLTFTVLGDDASADANGDAAWARVKDGDGNWVMDADITLDSGTGFIRMPLLAVYAGGVIRITGGTLVEGNS